MKQPPELFINKKVIDMKKTVSMILALAMLLTSGFSTTVLADEGHPSFPQTGVFPVIPETGANGDAPDLFSSLAGFFGGLLGGIVSSVVQTEDFGENEDDIVTVFDGCGFWESGDLKMEIVFQDGYYKVAIQENGTELSYLCVLDKMIDKGVEYSRLTGIGTGDMELDAVHPDHGQSVFIWDIGTDMLVWLRDDNPALFTRIIDSPDGNQ